MRQLGDSMGDVADKEIRNQENGRAMASYLSVRGRIIDGILVILSAASVLTLVLSVPRHVAFGVRATGYVAYGIVAVFLVLTALRSRLTFRFKTGCVLCASFTLGILSLLDWGLSGMYAVYFMGTVFLTSLLLGFRSGLFVLVVSLLVIISVACLVVTGYIGYEIDYHRFFQMPATWLLAVSHIGLFAFVILIGFKRIHQSLFDIVEQLQQRSDELKAVNNRLMESETLYRLLADNATDMIWTLDENLYTRFVSPQVFTLRGFSVEEALGQHLKDVICESSFLSVKEVLLDEIGGDSPRFPKIVTFEAEMQCKHGGLVQTETCARVLRKSDREDFSFVAVTRDITRRKQIEKEKKELLAQLSQAQQLESTGRLAGGIAHDFNNMLSAILGYTDLSMKMATKIAVQKESQGARLYQNLVEIRTAAERSAEMTRQLLAFARRQPTVPRTLDLNAVVEELLPILHRLIGENIYFAWLPSVDIPPVKMDPAQIDQILVNLCVNARDAICDVGTITISTGVSSGSNVEMTESSAPEDRCVQLTVSDDGCGMSAITREHVFEPFFTTKETGKGSGLGLPTVYGIVTQHKGRIHLESSPGNGTTVTICLPAQSGHNGEQTATPEALDTADDILGGTETILLVEDEATVLTVIAEGLCSLGYRVLRAGDPKEALEICSDIELHIDLLITDVVMAGMNGRALADAVLDCRSDVRCLFMSGYTDDIVVKHGVFVSDVHFIQKPFSLVQLAKIVRAALLK